MWLILSPAHATALTMCGASLLADAPEPRVLVSCEGSSAPPGGPVSHFHVAVGDLPVSVHLRGVELGALRRVEARDDGSAVYAVDVPLWPGLTYEIRGGDVLGQRLMLAGPDLAPLQRCATNPDTCVDAAGRLPAALGPALRLQACVRGVDCAAHRADPSTDVAREALELACIAMRGPACARVAELDPTVSWGWVQPDVPGSGRLRPTGLRYVLLPAGDALEVGWGMRGPSVFAVGEPRLPVDRTSSRELRVSPEGVAVVDGRRTVWSWPLTGVQEAALRDDGQQLLVRSGRLVAWVAFDGQQMGAFEGFPPSPRGVPLDGTVIDPGGWPVAGARVRAACDADDAERRCAATTDLLGRFRLAGAHGGLVQVDDGTGPRDVVAIPGLPVRLPEGTEAFDFGVDDAGRVTRAAAPLRPGDVVVAVGPLPVDRAPSRDSGPTSVPRALWPGLASQWGSVEVIRAGARLTLRPEPR